MAIMGSAILIFLIGMTALVAEFGHGLVTRVENQRVADLAAYAGALAYNASSSTPTMEAAIAQVAALNGLESTEVRGWVEASPRGNGNQAVTVSVTRTNLLLLAPVLGSSANLVVGARAWAEIATETAAACIVALDTAGSGVTLSGGTAVSAPKCSVNSNAAVTVPCGTSITTKTVTYNSSSAPSQPCSGIKAPAGTASVSIKKTVTTDPLASSPAVASATSRLATVAAQTGPSAPSVTAPSGGSDIEFGWDQSTTQQRAAAAGCSASFASGSNIWTLTCQPGSTARFGNVSLGGGIKLDFNPGGVASNVYEIGGALTNASSGTITFGPGTYKIGSLSLTGTNTFGDGSVVVAGNAAFSGTVRFGNGTFTFARGLTTGGGSTVTFGAGTFHFGAGTSACTWNSGTVSICHTGTTLTFGGPSTFKLSAGIAVNGGATLTMGSGSTNSYDIGAGSAGYAFILGGGSFTKLADANLFKVSGNIDSGGGSCFAMPASGQHDIKGFVATGGGTILGAGVYTVSGYVALGGNGGGSVTCWGNSVGMTGAGVTLVIGGSSTPSGGNCSGQAFCVAAGYSRVALTAPTTGATANLAVVGPTGGSRAGASFTQGGSGTSLSGALYFPKGPITLSGGASIGDGSGQCLQIIGSLISLSGGTAAASECLGSGSSGGGAGTPVLVQ
ncbi:pilus assembly protein TadG-related protein [Enterovirga rhinocerotis]|uniref:Putative Flp pilus-assembly TadE/G-like protein n=1 Tax=Enterovirga rhinocerotis TaxID=1339210 RepID=A0A4R7BHE6_9HYPH|nr:pilus assembly protein TadG-related protein [Enterovirga rhinocerotis]TDR84531.1 putative Flp pilus-assembly TadE/G-like protein [Enterovirga rhinocerotis]